ncbi:MAG: hypothetical protein AABW75_04165, partial [Nanoarchaeota archaeon]
TYSFIPAASCGGITENKEIFYFSQTNTHSSIKIETSRFVFAQSPYFSSRASKSNLDGAQEPEHAPDFSPKVLDKLIIYENKERSKRLSYDKDFNRVWT